MVNLARESIRKGYSVRELERKVIGFDKRKNKVKTKGMPAWQREIEENLCNALGHKVHVKFTKRKAQIIIDLPNRESFENLYSRLIEGPLFKEEEKGLEEDYII